MKHVLKYYRPYLPQIIVVVALVFVQAMTDLQLPTYMAKIVNDGITTGNMSVIYSTGGKMLLITLLSVACTLAAGFLSSRIAAGASKSIRSAIFSRVEGFSLAEFNKFSSSSLITRTTNDVTQVQQATVMTLRMVLFSPIMAVGAIIRALENTTSMAWIIILAVAILLGMMSVVFAILMPRFRQSQKKTDRLNQVTRENLTGLRVIRAYNTEDIEQKRFDIANLDLTNLSRFIGKVFVAVFPFMMLVMNVIMLLIIWVGAHQVATSGLPIGNMMAFMQYAMHVIMSFLMLSMVFIVLPRAQVSANRIGEVLETTPIINDPENPKSPERAGGRVEFNNVTFSYSGAEEPVLSNITFSAEPGQTTAFIGSTGSGKSTIINLIPRFYDVTEGSVSVDGVDVREMTQHELRERIGYVPQQGMLLSGSIKEAIGYGISDDTRQRIKDDIGSDDEAGQQEYEEILMQRIKDAAGISQASGFIESLEEGYETHVAQGAKNVSGGQKQRLAIARAMVRLPEIYIFDDSFSALDFKTDAKLRKELEAVTQNSTVLIVAQRISTILTADKIIVLDEGRIAGQGTHEQLLENCEVYQEIAYSQLSKEELS